MLLKFAIQLAITLERFRVLAIFHAIEEKGFRIPHSLRERLQISRITSHHSLGLLSRTPGSFRLCQVVFLWLFIVVSASFELLLC